MNSTYTGNGLPRIPALSVCIANYQGEAVIRRCLDSVLEQQCDFSFEVIVHDDASTDHSREIIEREYPEATLLSSPENVGFCLSNNRMVETAEGEYILLLNNDTRLHPDSLQVLLGAARARDDVGILSLPQYDMTSGELLDCGMFLDLFGNSIPCREPGQDIATVSGSCLLIKREIWNRLGGFPTWFGSLAEDLYLCTRVRLMGLGVRVLDNGGYDHVVGHSFGGGKIDGNQLASSYRRRRLSELNKNRVIATCFPAPAHVLIMALQFILLLAEGTVLGLLKGSLRPLREIYLPSIFGILGDLRRVHDERQRCMALRQVSTADFFAPVRLRHHKLSLLRRHGVPSLS